ncbi:MAG: TetR/AcrR family transcriptional regulator [Acidimicrobiales bacterium]
MPKIVDHDQRRAEISEAVMRVIARDGLAAVTLASVSDESGWSRGVLTHYFDNKASLLEGGLRQGMREISANLEELVTLDDPRRALLGVLEEILPLDERRLAFGRVYVAFMAESLVSEQLRSYFTYNHAAWREAIAAVVRRGQQRGRFSDVIRPATAADELGALTEGLRQRRFNDPTISDAKLRSILRRAVDDRLVRT